MRILSIIIASKWCSRFWRWRVRPRAIPYQINIFEYIHTPCIGSVSSPLSFHLRPSENSGAHSVARTSDLPVWITGPQIFLKLESGAGLGPSLSPVSILSTKVGRWAAELVALLLCWRCWASQSAQVTEVLRGSSSSQGWALEGDSNDYVSPGVGVTQRAKSGKGWILKWIES